MDGKSLGLMGIAAVIGGVVGGITVRLSSDSPKTTAKAETPASKDDDEDDGLDHRVKQLEQSVAGLEKKRRASEAIAAYGRALAAGDPAPDGGVPSPTAVDDPVFDTAVRDVLDRVDQERRDEREQRRTERMNQMVDEWSKQLATKLSLSDQQKQKVAEIFRDHFAKMRAMRGGGDGGMRTPQEWRQSFQALQDEQNKKLGEVLDSGQMDKLEQMRKDGELPMFGGGFGRGRRRGN